MKQNAILSGVAEGALVERLARRAVAGREAEYAHEVRRLLDAALTVVRHCGAESRPRVADIVAAAGMSNDAFYRHFRSKDALMAAVLTDGIERLAEYVAHRMAGESESARKVGQWVEGILGQADDDIAQTTRAVLWHAGSLGQDMVGGRTGSAAQHMAVLLHEPFVELGVREPEFPALLVAYATIGRLGEYLRAHAQPSSVELARVTAFCLAAASAATNASDSAGAHAPGSGDDREGNDIDTTAGRQ